jgi:hypothetical protein
VVVCGTCVSRLIRREETMHTRFRYLNRHIRQRDEAHGRADNQWRLDPWVVLLEGLDVGHVY